MAATTQDQPTVRAPLPASPPPFPELAPPSRVSLQREYVAGGGWGWYGGKSARTLPNAIDDIAQDFGDDIYDRMLVDPQIAACINVYKASILETGPSITSAIADRDHPEYDLAAQICDEAIRMLEDLESSFGDWLWNMLDSAAVGNKVSEKIYAEAKSVRTGKQLLNLSKLKVKARRTTLFATDTYLNLVGVLVAVPPNAEPVPGTTYFTQGQVTGDRQVRFGLVPREKFAISVFRPRDSDPRGTSIIRPAYAPWWRKQQVIPEYLKYLAQFAGPSLVGVAAPDANPVPDPTDPTKTISQTQALMTALEQFRNMSAIAVANGADVRPINMQGDGQAFRSAMADANEEITKAILTQQLATEEGRHMARAAATVHQDVLDTIVRQGKLSVQDMIRNQLFKQWIAVNWEGNPSHLAPIADLGATEQRDKPGLWQGAAALMNSKYFTEDQLQAMDAMLGVPVRQRITALAFQVVKLQAKGKATQPADQTEQQDDEPADPNKIRVRPHERNRPRPRTPDQPGQPVNPQDQQPDSLAYFDQEDQDDDELQAA